MADFSLSLDVPAAGLLSFSPKISTESSESSSKKTRAFFFAGSPSWSGVGELSGLKSGASVEEGEGIEPSGGKEERNRVEARGGSLPTTPQ